MRRTGTSLLLLFLISACAKPFDQNEMVWSQPLSYPCLKPGVTVRSHPYRYIDPAIGETYVIRRDRTRVRTFAELQTVLRPIDTLEIAVWYRRLLGMIELERDEALTALDQSLPLELHDGDSAFYGVYVASDATRWNVPHEPVIETTAEIIVITQPTFRRSWLYDETGDWVPGLAFVELVREVFYRDGRYEREIVRELERGKSALVHEPAPLI